MNHDNFSALRAFATSPGYYEPSPTISLAETSLMTPSSPQSYRSTSVHQDEKKPTKKRKSWGQELPTPKTNLPPRKRAKTEDEKEQRRIERVLRNRQAAQSSRERKRLEVEKLEGEKYSIERQNYHLKQRLLAVEHEKFALKQQIARMAAALGLGGQAPTTAPSAPPSPAMTTEALQHDKAIKQEMEEYSFLPSPQPSARVTLDPRASSYAPSSSSSRSPSPAHLDFANNGSSDMTQHPAEMLCGLQCQSEETCCLLKNPSSSPDEAQYAHPPQLTPQALTTLHLFLTLHSAVSSAVLKPLSQLLISLKKGSPMKTTKMTPTLFYLIQWLISTPANPVTQSTPTSSLPSTNMINTATNNTISSHPRPRSSTFRTSLLRRLLSCSPALARPLKDATCRALHMKTRHALRGNFDGSCEVDGNDGDRVRCCGDDARSRKEVWRLMTMAVVIDQWEKQRQSRKDKGETAA